MARERILLIDDDKTFRSVTRTLLEDEGFKVEAVESAKMGLRVLQEKAFDLVLSDVVMPEISGLELLEQIKGMPDPVSVVMVTGFASIESAVEAMKRGAEDYLTKPCGSEELLLKIRRVIAKNRDRRELQQLRQEISGSYSFENFIGRSSGIRQVIALITQVAGTDATVLVHGETGTGKELVAKAIHYNSPRRHGPFVGVNCAALADPLFESELFGHEKGAFTGAIKQKLGRFEMADKGTLFLDEVGDIPLATQAKLLRVLQERKFERVGGTETLEVDLRLISATNQNLRQLIKAGSFREDLYFRLNVVPITLPPLRERREDIPLLAEKFVRHFSARSRKSVTEISAAAMDMLLHYHWPGNVRELENLIERAIVITPDSHIKPEHLMLTGPGALEPLLTEAHDHRLTEEELVRRYARLILNEAGGNKKEACRILGINFRTLQRRLGEE